MIANCALMASGIMSLFYRATDFYLHQISVIKWYDRRAETRFTRTFHGRVSAMQYHFGTDIYNLISFLDRLTLSWLRSRQRFSSSIFAALKETRDHRTARGRQDGPGNFHSTSPGQFSRIIVEKMERLYVRSLRHI